MRARLVSYRLVWDRRPSDDYEYQCFWSDGTETMEPTLPWGDMDGAVELPMTSLRELYPPKPVTLDDVTLAVIADICATNTLSQRRADEPYPQAAE